MLKVIFVGNIEANRLEAEIRDERYDLVAIVYEDSDGWHVERHSSTGVPGRFLRKVKDELMSRPNRRGNDAPEGMSRGEYSLWLLE